MKQVHITQKEMMGMLFLCLLGIFSEYSAWKNRLNPSVWVAEIGLDENSKL
jgi:hypothetical protein